MKSNKSNIGRKCGMRVCRSGVNLTQKAVGLTPNLHNGGFTLIELLVVVLIIGILAAVALPQYKVAVAKSRVGAMLPVMKSISDAEEVYYLKNGVYTSSHTNLDVALPADCKTARYAGHNSCGKDFFLLITQNGVVLHYCPKNNDTWEQCSPKSEFEVYRFYQHSSGDYQDYWSCYSTKQTELGKKVCKSMTFN